MTDERKQQLITNYAAALMKQKYPELDLKDTEKLQELFSENEEELIDKINDVSEEEWQQLADQETVFAAKGAKLQKLKSGAKKCKCGCAMVDIKDKGGKLVSKCACGCDVKKAQAGAKLPVVKKPAPSFKDKVAAEEKADSAAVAKAYPKSDVAKQFNKNNPSKKPILKEKGGKVVDRIAKAKLIKKK